MTAAKKAEDAIQTTEVVATENKAIGSLPVRTAEIPDGSVEVELAHYWRDNAPGDKVILPVDLARSLDESGYVVKTK